MFGLGDMLQTMTAGKRVDYNGERWLLLSNTTLRTPDGRALFVAVRESDAMPAQTYLIPGPADVHLQARG